MSTAHGMVQGVHPAQYVFQSIYPKSSIKNICSLLFLSSLHSFFSFRFLGIVQTSPPHFNLHVTSLWSLYSIIFFLIYFYSFYTAAQDWVILYEVRNLVIANWRISVLEQVYFIKGICFSTCGPYEPFCRVLIIWATTHHTRLT